MITDAREVMADIVAGYMPEGDGGQDARRNLAIADAALAALTAAGYEVVRADDTEIKRWRAVQAILEENADSNHPLSIHLLQIVGVEPYASWPRQNDDDE